MASDSSASTSSLSSEEETDLSDLKPIKEYLSDRKELTRQVFKSVKSEKLQMMLPQVLKKVNLNDLEEWCASELSGMSKARILSILNGTPMLKSSDTDDSDSGPSLEIISDTEEWLTDDTNKQEELSSSSHKKEGIKKEKKKMIKKSQTQKKGEKSKVKLGSKEKNKDKKYRDVKIKKEAKEPEKEKEGDSLLDLLELEMRARAIRALIRKEEDIIPNTDKSNNSSNKSEDTLKTIAQNELKAKEKCRRQLEEIITSKQNTIGDDEDVVLVVQPTPTIELSSSESDNEQSIEKKQTTQEPKELLTSTSENKGTEILSKTPDTSNNITENAVTAKDSKDNKNKNLVKNKDSKISIKEKRDKSKKSVEKHKKHLNINKTNESIEELNCNANSTSENIEKVEDTKTISSNNKNKESDKEMKDEKSIIAEKHKSNINNDMEEIIDLDDYSNDIDNLENNDHNEDKLKDTSVDEVKNKQENQLLNLSETWATRYYQTDDVQHVLKESKIQSEIRKRLRERQRLSKLNNTANTTNKTVEMKANKTSEPKPTGSVEEYLALKSNVATDNT